MKISENISLSELTTMKLGGPVNYVVDVEAIEDIPSAYKFAEKKQLPVYILGNGSNTIGRDEGFKGVIIRNHIRGITSRYDENDNFLIKGMGGEKWDDIVEYACKNGYSGIEAMSMIPGTLGAAPVQNIGAYGQDVAQVIDSVEVYNSVTNQYETLPAELLQMGYRRSVFNYGEMAGKYFIISVTIRVHQGSLQPPFYTSLQAYVDEHQVTDFSPNNIRRIVTEIRSEKLPDPAVVATAGSFFKNIYLTDEDAMKAEARGMKIIHRPGENKISAGWMLEECGLKGQSFHGMRVSDKSALILINEGAKSYADLADARFAIQQIVRTKFGLTLQQEPVEVPTR